MQHREVSSWEQLCIPMERVDLPLETALRPLGTAWALITVALLGKIESVGAKGVDLSQAWNPHGADIWIHPNTYLPRKVN